MHPFAVIVSLFMFGAIGCSNCWTVSECYYIVCIRYFWVLNPLSPFLSPFLPLSTMAISLCLKTYWCYLLVSLSPCLEPLKKKKETEIHSFEFRFMYKSNSIFFPYDFLNLIVDILYGAKIWLFLFWWKIFFIKIIIIIIIK